MLEKQFDTRLDFDSPNFFSSAFAMANANAMRRAYWDQRGARPRVEIAKEGVDVTAEFPSQVTRSGSQSYSATFRIDLDASTTSLGEFVRIASLDDKNRWTLFWSRRATGEGSVTTCGLAASDALVGSVKGWERHELKITCLGRSTFHQTLTNSIPLPS